MVDLPPMGGLVDTQYLITQLSNAQVVELVDTQDLKSCGHCGRAGSSPAPGTKSAPNFGALFYFISLDFLILKLKKEKHHRSPFFFNTSGVANGAVRTVLHRTIVFYIAQRAV